MLFSRLPAQRRFLVLCVAVSGGLPARSFQLARTATQHPAARQQRLLRSDRRSSSARLFVGNQPGFFSGSGSNRGNGSRNGSGDGAASFGGRDPAQMVADGRRVAGEALGIVREVGLPAAMKRTVAGQRAILQTSLELLRELPPPTASGVTTLPDLLELPRQLARGDTGALRAYLDRLPAGLAPATLRKLFERLGATYIKLGQFIASSPTLFPPEYVLEFQKCLDQSPTVSYDEVRAIVEADLGQPIDALFSDFDKEPLASASVAQVHGAVLRGTAAGAPGRRVVVKVRKPGVAETLQADLGFLSVGANVLEYLAPSLSRLSLANVVADLRASMLKELDFTEEAKNLEAFRAFLRVSSLEGIATAPAPYPAASGARVLTMERLYGVPLTDLAGIDAVLAQGSREEGTAVVVGSAEEVLVNALNVWTMSVVGCESFHADVHAGNLLVLKDGRVGFIDFGIVGKIPAEIWGAVTDLAAAFAGGGGGGQPDFEGMACALVAMGAAERDVDTAAFARDLRAVVEELDRLTPVVTVAAASDGAGNTVAAASIGVDDTQVTRLALELVGVAERNGVKLPRAFGILLKQVLYFDRYTRLLAPGLDVMQDDRLRIGTPNAGEQQGAAATPLGVVDV